MQKIDVGIAICHLHLIMKEKGVKGSFVDCDPGIEAPKNTYYITSFVIVDADETN